MGYAILRVQKLKSGHSVRRSLKHAFREQETPNANPELTRDNTHIGAQNVAEALQAFNARLPEKLRANAVLGIEYLVTASPEDLKAKTREQQDAYFGDALEWLRKRHGAENVVYAGIHRDETSPHLYAYVVPIDPNGKLNCRHFLGGAKALHHMQSDFAESVGKQHNLSRGIEGSKGRHQTVREFYSRIQQPTAEVTITPEAIRPRVLKQGFLSRTEESPEQVAERLTNAVREVYQPALANAAVAAQERVRAEQMAKTAGTMREQLSEAQKRLQAAETVLKPFVELGQLDRDAFVDQVAEARRKAEQLRRQKETEAEFRRRIDDLERVKKRLAGPAHTLAQHALEAIDHAGGDPKRVDWRAVEKAAAVESMRHGQDAVTVFSAIVKHSPGLADPAHQELARQQLSKLAGKDLKPQPTKSKDRDRGMDFSR